MKNIIFSLIFVLIALACAGCVCAADAENSPMGISIDENNIGFDSTDSVLASGEIDTGIKKIDRPTYEVHRKEFRDPTCYADLHLKIMNAKENSTIYLKNDYKGGNNFAASSFCNIVIEGNGHTLDGSKSETAIIDSRYAHMTLKNLKIINGKHTAVESSKNGTLTLINCTFINNAGDMGGAIRNNAHSKLTIIDSIFQSNSAKQNGGAVFSEGPLDLINCKFESNKAKEYGGAVLAKDTLNIINSTFMKNQVTLNGGATYGYNNIFVNGCEFESNKAMEKSNFDNCGGAIYSKKSVIAEKSSFKYNRADDHGGAIYAEDSINVKGKTSYFNENEAHGASGGALFAVNNIILHNSEFSKNHAKLDGGAAYSLEGLVYADNNIFTSNKATGKDKYQNAGGALFSRDSMTIDRCTFKYNKADDNGGVAYCKRSITVKNSQLIENIANDDNGGALFAMGSVIIDNTTLNGNRLMNTEGQYTVKMQSSLKTPNSTITKPVIKTEEQYIPKVRYL